MYLPRSLAFAVAAVAAAGALIASPASASVPAVSHVASAADRTDQYDAFIADVRDDVSGALPGDQRLSRLTAREVPGNQFVLVSLDEMLPGSGIDEVELVVDPGNLYVYGYYHPKSDTAYALKGVSTDRVKAASGTRKAVVPLSFDANYKGALSSVAISPTSLITAQKTLAASDRTKGDDSIKAAVHLFAVSVSEGVRFRSVQEKIAGAMRSGSTVTLTGEDQEWILSWADASRFVIDNAPRGVTGRGWFTLTVGGKEVKYSYEKTASILAVAKNV